MAIPGPAVPVGYDFGLDEQLLLFASVEDMTEEQFGQLLGLQAINLESPTESFSSHNTWDAERSPGRSWLQPSSNANSSNSPGTGSSVILTPNSTFRELHGDGAHHVEDLESEQRFASTEGNISPISDDYVHVNVNGSSTIVRNEMSDRPPHSAFEPGSTGALASSSSRRSRLSSVAPSTQLSDESHGQWTSFGTVAAGEWMDHSNPGRFGHPNIPNTYAFNDDAIAATEGVSSDILADIDAFGGPADADFINGSLPFRISSESGDVSLPDAYLHSAPFAPPFESMRSYDLQQQYQQHQQLFTQHQRVQHGSGQAGLQLAPTDNVFTTGSPLPQGLYAGQRGASVMHQRQGQRRGQRQTIAPGTFMTAQSAAHRNRQVPYPQLTSQTRQPVQQGRYTMQQPVQVQPPSSVIATPARPLRPAVPGPSRSRSVLSSQNDRLRKGGREKGSNLATGTREKSHKMRKAGACWRCALQRDTCPDEGTPCQRCVDRASKGSLTFFPCNRSKLPDFVYDFLPPSMTLMHQKQTIEDCVKNQVYRWDTENSVDVYFTSGYGPALRWKLCEFKPKTEELLNQYQYLQDVASGRCVKHEKYSPPLGLAQLNTSDDSHFDKYLSDLLEPQHLQEFGQTCFEEETQIDTDGEPFQATLMGLMCEMYTQLPQGSDLHGLLARVIRMMVVTYIMGHTLTLVQETLYGVLETIKYSRKPTANQMMNLSHTSPRLANRQLKFFFCTFRTKMIENILGWCQQTLHSSGKKEQTWLPSFCVMLGLAMAVEELQRTLHIQADAKASKGEMSEEAADVEAFNACERMDADFELMIGLFQCKYRDKTWSASGSFGHGTPTLQERASVAFLQRLYTLVLDKRAHLEDRRNVQLGKDNQCLYTSRLVARFLLPFLNLPA